MKMVFGILIIVASVILLLGERVDDGPT